MQDGDLSGKIMKLICRDGLGEGGSDEFMEI